MNAKKWFWFSGGGNIPSDVLLWDDGTPVLWDDGSYILWS